MERMVAVMIGDPAAAIAGLVAMICLVTWPLLRTRSAMLAAYMGNNLAFMVHYALLDQWTAVTMNGLMGVQTVVAIIFVHVPGLRLVYYALMPVVAVACLMTWQGLPSLLSAVATAFSTVGRMQSNDAILRGLLLASTPFWMAHDLAVGSLPGLVADVLSMATGATMLLRRSPSIRAAITVSMQRLGLIPFLKRKPAAIDASLKGKSES